MSLTKKLKIVKNLWNFFEKTKEKKMELSGPEKARCLAKIEKLQEELSGKERLHYVELLSKCLEGKVDISGERRRYLESLLAVAERRFQAWKENKEESLQSKRNEKEKIRKR